jgi:mannonate dehydratase
MTQVINSDLMIESFRWFGPKDPVSLAGIRQTGAQGIYTALHHIPYGETWPLDEILKRQAEVAAHHMTWVAVEPIPVSEAIKSRTGDYKRHIANYCESIRNLGKAGVHTVLNCFMPALEWIRTDLTYRLPDGKECLYYDEAHFAAFDVFLLKREGAEKDYSEATLKTAEAWLSAKTHEDREVFGRGLCKMFPGISVEFTYEDLKERIKPFQAISPDRLRENLRLFLVEVTPVAEEAGVRLAMHPDDPPFPLLGLPRILSTEADFKWMLDAVDSPANGMCYCTGSLGARDDNDMVGIIERLGDRIHAVHLRNVQRNPGGIFYEADHLGGSVDMPSVVHALLREQARRRKAGRAEGILSFRPDHGHRMLDDLNKPQPPNPGYTCIGRMRGLAELRGLQQGIIRGMRSA